MSFLQSSAVRTMRASCLLLMGFLVAPSLAAQAPDDFISSGSEMTRTDLETRLSNLEAAATDEAYGAALRARAEAEAAIIRARLREGDFRVGDRIQVFVAGEDWGAGSPGAVQNTALAPVAGEAGAPTGRGSVGATFAVQAGPAVKLPDMPAIGLSGVLRSELNTHLTAEIGRYIRNPEVIANSLIRLSVFGDVGSPGFYYAAADQHLGDVIMLAGGPGQTAQYEKLQIRRGNEVLWEGESLQQVMAQGRTLDQLNLQAGDVVEVPQETSNPIWAEVGRFALIIGTTVLLGIRVF